MKDKLLSFIDKIRWWLSDYKWIILGILVALVIATVSIWAVVRGFGIVSSTVAELNFSQEFWSWLRSLVPWAILVIVVLVVEDFRAVVQAAVITLIFKYLVQPDVIAFVASQQMDLAQPTVLAYMVATSGWNIFGVLVILLVILRQPTVKLRASEE